MSSEKDGGPPIDADKIKADLMELLKRKQENEEDLEKLENEIYTTETEYLENTSLNGANAVRGYRLAVGNSLNRRTHQVKAKDSERLFSNSSVTFIRENENEDKENADPNDNGGYPQTRQQSRRKPRRMEW